MSERLKEKGCVTMAFETKVILTLLIDTISKAENVKEAYNAVAKAARVEGLIVPEYEDAVEQLKETRKK